ncbi:MAG: helix-turn-helix domain-containing protein [Alphaproteobacteria bacterium]|nr:helix-turn-helix domain-containing protein [Alphaproteobacteria bacterium]
MEKEINESEEIETVGAMLREARIKSGKSVADIAEELCIRKAYVIAIEEMDFANIPPRPFGIGFIRSYAEMVGLNSDRIVSSYRQSFHENKEERISEKVSGTSFPLPHFKHILIGVCGLAVLFAVWSVLPLSEQVEAFQEDAADIIPEPVIVVDENTVSGADSEFKEKEGEITSETVSDEKAGEQYKLNETAAEKSASEENSATDKTTEVNAEETKENTEVDALETENIDAKNETSGQNNVETTSNEESGEEFHKMRMVLSGPSWVEIKQGDKIILRGSIYKRGYSYNVPQEKGLTITVGKPRNTTFYIDEKPAKVVSVMNSKRVSLDEFLIKKDN